MKIWHNLEEDAKRARDLLNADPDNEALAKSALEKAERVLVFGELMKFGHSAIERAVERFKSDDSSLAIDVVEELRDEGDDDARDRN